MGRALGALSHHAALWGPGRDQGGILRLWLRLLHRLLHLGACDVGDDGLVDAGGTGPLKKWDQGG